ncbi:MAG: FAD-binding oxidoreductase [Gammaproteobacteria bacterium]|nr:FAD-binding oxidoreductase [Gammaproteobacteria bacterium]
MPLNKYPQSQIIVDGENHSLLFDYAYSVTAMSINEAIREIFDKHGEDIHLLPLSASSAGAGVFQINSEQIIVALHLRSSVEPSIKMEAGADIQSVKLDEILIDSDSRRIYAGSAINLNQLNQALASELGSQYRVLGADLTSYTYAQVGATFMTGGMGPQRRYFSDSVCQIALHNGSRILTVEGDELKGYAGTYGWTGIVSAVCCDYVELPDNEVAFALPVNNTPHDLARLLAHFSSFTRLQFDSESRVSSLAGNDIILGLEHITLEAMQPFLHSADNGLTKRAAQLKLNCEHAEADGLIFVNGYCNLEVDEFLLRLVDNDESELLTISGIGLEFAEIFRDAEQMRAIREGIPYAARMQAPKGPYNFKGHTDANIRLNADCVEHAMRQLWQLNQQYVSAVQAYFDENESVRGEILVYGHLNPVGVDPHNRITFACDDESIYSQSVQFLDDQKEQYIVNLAKLCVDTASDFVGGEKSAGSEYEMLPAFADLNSTPPMLAEKVIQQRDCIQAASPLFKWRAMGAYQSNCH